jgi:hypothetical protein
VRGDSLRDLYAKALALLGLGLLGAAGALVDYWPVRGDLPTVASALALPDPLTAIPGVPTASLALSPVKHASITRPAPDAMTDRQGAAAAALETVVTADLADVVPETRDPLALSSVAAPPPPSLAVELARPDNIPSSTLALMPPVILAPEAFLSVPPVSASSGDNMFEAAAKTAGRVGLKTGSAIANGFKAVGHIIRWPL